MTCWVSSLAPAAATSLRWPADVATGIFMMVSADSESHALTLQLLVFLAASERTYGETMEAWRSTCPQMSIWKDAVRDSLVSIQNGGSMTSSRVVLTARGRARLGTPA
jgi:hypothetical protein